MSKSPVNWVKSMTRRTRIIVAVAVYLAIAVWAIVASHVAALIIITILGAVIVGIVSNVKKTGEARKVKVLAAEGRTAWPKRFGPWMLKDERVEEEGRRHPIAILRWWVLCFGGPCLAFASLAVMPSLILFLILFFAPPLIASWHIALWWFEWRAITNYRVVEVTGILNVTTPAALLAQILTAKAIKPFFSIYVLEPLGFRGYGHIVFETAAQVEAIPELRYVPDVERVNALLQSHFIERR